MDAVQLQSRLMAAFVAELEEHVGALNRDALALEQHPSATELDQVLRRLFRTAHTVKSAARVASVGALETAAHRLEDLLAATRDGAVPVDAALLSVLFATADALDDARLRLRETGGLGGESLSELISRIDALARGEPSVAAPPPTSRREPRPEARPVSPEPPEPAAALVVRLAADKLDALLERSSELLLAVRRLEQPVRELDALRERTRSWSHEVSGLERELGPAVRSLPEALRVRLQHILIHWRDAEAELDRLTERVDRQRHDLERLVEPLLDDVRRARMLPFAEACGGLERLARDLAVQAGKQAVLRVVGGQVEIDRVVLEELKDPLRHLVRNALDHGLEPPAERRAAGKAEVGEVRVTASLQGQRVAIVVSDDGRGVDREAVGAEARRRGLPAPEDDAALGALLQRAGFSTARAVTDVSGRGVGLDVVRERVEAMNGSIALETDVGRGTSFTLSVPLTLSGLRVLLVRVGGAFFALPTAALDALARVPRADVLAFEGRDCVAWRGRHVPLLHLGRHFGLPFEPPPPGSPLAVVVLSTGGGTVGCVVDELLAEADVTVRPLGPRLRHLPAVAGATVLPDGRVALILATTPLLRAAAEAPDLGPVAGGPEAVDRPRPHVLLVEDSLTTRTLEKMILEAAGYRVTAAVDGRDALDRLGTAAVDLIVSDVQMPRVDGFELTRAVRASPRHANVPIVLVTGMDSEADRCRGLEAGASAYLVKSAFDQAELLATLEHLL